MNKPTQDLNFWRQRLQEGGNVENAMAVGFVWNVIDQVHKEYISKHIKNEDKVLDAGCAYGRTASWYSDKQYVGVDFFPEFIEEAKKRHPTKRFINCSLLELPFEDKQFDWAVLTSVKRVIQSDPQGPKLWPKVEAELKRCCKKIMILEYGNSDPSEIHKAFEIIE